jgi:hypothetical protein
MDENLFAGRGSEIEEAAPRALFLIIDIKLQEPVEPQNHRLS